jgi:phosphotransferase system HPr (HPr) family protein
VIRRDVHITNRLGLHARAAARFVQTATRYRSRITLGRDTRAMDGKSILGILLLAAAQGSVLTVTADGDDEEAAVIALADLVSGRFGEEV